MLLLSPGLETFLHGISWVIYVFLVLWSIFLWLTCAWALIAPFPKRQLVGAPMTSVLVAAWNEEDSISACIESIRSGDYPKEKTEIIVVGGGTDRTSAICKKYSENGLIQFIQTDVRMGKWHDLNLGVTACRGDFIAFTDSDCTVERSWLSELGSGMVGGNDGVIGLVLPSYSKSYISKGFRVLLPGIGMGAFLLSRFTTIPFVSGPSSGFKKNVFTELRFEPSLIEDIVFVRRAGKSFKLGINLFANVFHNFGANTREFYKEVARWVGGYVSEISKSFTLSSSLVAASLFLMPIMAILSLAELLSGDLTVLLLLGVLILGGFCYCSISLYRLRKLNWIADFPYAIVLVAMLGILSFASILSTLIHGNVEWRLAEKSRTESAASQINEEKVREGANQ